MAPRLLALGLMPLLASLAVAADDPLFTDPVLEEWGEEAGALHRAYGNLSLVGDRVTGFSERDDVERGRLRLRLGWRGEGDGWEYALALKAGLGSDSNRDNRRNNDNEKSDSAGLDEAFWRWRGGEDSALTFGKTALPLSLTPMVWDSDLRPVGLALQQRWSVGDVDALRFSGGYFAGDHLYGDRSRIAAAQLGWLFREGAPFSADVQLALLHFSGLERAVAQGLTRSNRRVGNRLLSDYRLLDLQFGARWQLGEKPLSARLDLLRNLGADDLDRGTRASLVYGNADAIPGWEIGFSWQRIQRDAAMAAFNEDDWWFHSDARGVMPWVAYGFAGGWSLQASLFVERRDASQDTLDRLLVELRRAF